VFLGTFCVTLVPLVFISMLTYFYTIRVGENDTILYTTQVSRAGLDKLNVVMERSSNIVASLLSSPQLESMLRAWNANYEEVGAQENQALFNQVNQMLVYVSGVYAMNYDILDNTLVMSDKTRIPIIFSGRNEDPGFYDEVKALKGKIKCILKKSSKDSYEIYVAGAMLDVINNDVIGEVCVHVNKDYSESIVNRMAQKGEYSFVLTPENQIALHTDAAFVGKQFTDNAVLKEVDLHDSGYKVMKIDSQNYIVTYSTSEKNGWKFIDVIPYRVISDKSFESTSFILIIAAIAFLFAVILSRALSSAIYSPVRRLMKAMNNVDGDHLNVRVEMEGTDEFAMVGESFNKLMERVKTLITLVKEEQVEKKEAEMTALRAQVNPHFLYNILNVIKCLAADQDTAAVQQVTVALIDLLRISIGNSRDVITLGEEIKYVEAYISIQKFRTDKEFTFENTIDRSLYDYQIPKFSLQPLVENAIIHGISNGVSDNVIALDGRLDGPMLLIMVSDNGQGLRGGKLEELQTRLDNTAFYRFNQVGMMNVNERIKIRYGNEYGLKIDSRESEGTVITVSLPALREI